MEEMDDTATAPANTTNIPQTPPSDPAIELAHVTKEMYKKNLELAEKNKTLSLLRKIDEIILGSVTDTKEIAQQVVNSVVEEADVKAAAILLYDKKSSSLTLLAISQTDAIARAEMEYGRKYMDEPILLSQTENVIGRAVIERKMQTTDKLYNVLLPSFTEEESAKIQELLGITKTLVYPLIVRQEVLGAMTVAIGEKDEIMSAYQKDLIDRLAAVVGIAIDNALLYQHIHMANERLKELDKMKDEFVSLASHELRTPMTAIKSYIWMLLENKMIQDEKGIEYLRHAYQATDRLIDLVNDMLNVSRIESGRMIINPAPVNLPELVTDVIAEVNPAAQKQGVMIETNAKTVSLPPVQADMNKIKEVFINLIGNAIKFTPSGGKISINLGQQDSMVTASISDTGKGIRPEDMSKLFTKFGMIEENYLQRQPAKGTGLGLYICKSIVELHGGKITVTSKGENQGTTFTFTLHKASLPQASQTPPHAK